MRRNRIMLLATSSAVAVLLLAGGLGLKVGATDSSFRQVVHFSEVLQLLLDNYVDPVETADLLEGAYEGMLASLDAHGAYLTPQEVARWKNAEDREIASPGISAVKAYGALQVVGVDAGSPAEFAGVKVGDQIRSIDGKSLRDVALSQAIALLAGAPGTTVRLDVLHLREDFQRQQIDVERSPRKVRPHELRVEGGVGVLSVRDLSRIDPRELASELQDVSSRGVEKLLLDLRNVVEQDPREAAVLSGLFVSGPLLSLRDGEGKVLESVGSSGQGSGWPGRLAVLVNGATAGGAEALASLLQTERGATVLGESSYGLGAEPKLFELKDGSGILISSAVWETASGRNWNVDGIEPDEEVLARGSVPEDALAEQLRRAIELFEAQTDVQRKAA